MNKQSDVLTIRKEFILLFIMGLILLDFKDSAIYWCYLLLPQFFIVLIRGKDLVDRNFFWILLYSLLYPLSLNFSNISSEISGSVYIGYFILPPVFYLMGKHLVKKYPNSYSVYFLLFFTCLLFSILPFAANVRSVLYNGFMTIRNIQFFWSDETQLQSATGLGATLAINMTLLPLLFVKKVSKNEIWLSRAAILLFVMGLFSILNMSNRTGLVIMVFSLLTYIVVSRNRITSILTVAFILVIIIIFFILDVGGIMGWFTNSQIFFRMSERGGLGLEDSRFDLWARSFVGIVKYPLGNVDYNIEANYAHNLWLDVGRKTGIVPMLPLVIFSVSMIIGVIRISLNNRYSDFFRMLIAGFGIAFILTFFVEPVMEGMFIMFLFFCFFSGTIQGILYYMNPDRQAQLAAT